jgi:hypothetical protein
VHRTSQPDGVRYGPAQVRRELRGQRFGLVHVAFLPARPRPALLVLVRVENRERAPLVLDLTETWGVERSDYRVDEAAAIAATSAGPRVLADAGPVPRARAPEPPPVAGLALDLRFAVPGRSRRQLYFVHAAPEPDENPAALVRAWRGEVEAELTRTVAVLGTSHSS